MNFRQDLELFILNVCLERFSHSAASHVIELYQSHGDLTEGLSGDPLFLVKDRNGKLLFVVKAFVDDRDTLENFAAIMTAHKLMESLEFNTFFCTPPIASIRLEREKMHITLIAFEAAQGQSVNSFLKSHAIEIACKAVEAQGCALAELNSIHADQAEHLSIYYIEQATQCLKECLQDIVAFSDQFPLNIQKLSMALLEKWKKVLPAPQPLGFIHGDAHPGNIFFDEKSNTLTLTDLDRLVYSIDAQSAPAGPIAFEFTFARLSLKFSAEAHHILSEDIVRLDEAFVRSYQKGIGNRFPSQDALDYYAALFWMRKVHLIAHAEPGIKPLMQEQVDLQRKMAIENIKTILRL